MKKFLLLSVGFAAAAFLVATTTLVQPAHAVDVLGGCSSAVCDKQPLFGANSIWTNILRIITFLLGAAAVLMIIVGGFKYVTANGDQSAITSAKNTILYSIVGLVIALMGGAIVNFVVDNLSK